jgi:hypothetical protein
MAGTPGRERYRTAFGKASICFDEVNSLLSLPLKTRSDETSPHQLYTTVSLRLGAVHDLRTRSNGDLSLDDIRSLRLDLELSSREIGLQMANIHDSWQKLAFMSPSIFSS